MDDGSFQAESVPADQLKAFIERVERIEAEIKGLNDDKRETYAEAKGNGFCAKTIKKIVGLRRKDFAERQEEDAILELYMHALGMNLGDAAPSRAPAPAPSRARARVEGTTELQRRYRDLGDA